MRQTLNTQKILGLGFMLFALFLGAGNLIFPPKFALLSGTNVWYTAIGFILSGVCLPVMGIITICLINGDFNNIAKELPKNIIIFLGSFAFLLIGLYATPRTAIVASDFSTTPIFGESSNIQMIFMVIFFSIAWLLSIYPGELLETVGEMITPVLLVLLAIMGIIPIIKPLGVAGEPVGNYQNIPIIQGFIDGYLTMDALAALMFGSVVVTNLKSHGITKPKAILKYSIITGSIAAICLSLVYLSLFNLGIKSGADISIAKNGVSVLSSYADSIFGLWGKIGLAIVVTLACVTTAIGCITAVSEYFTELFNNKISYKTIVTITCLICMGVSGLGLDGIIKIFMPILFILYPVFISLIVLTLIRPLICNTKLTYRTVVSITFIISIIEVLYDKKIFAEKYNLFIEAYFPFIHINLSWVFFAANVLLITMIFGKIQQSKAL